MADLIGKLRSTLQFNLENARQNVQTLREMAEEYSYIARLKFELHQLQSSKKKKLTLLGETVFPYLRENNIDGLKTHETLTVLVDEIKNLQNQIDLVRKAIDRVSEKETEPVDTDALREQINDLEEEIENRLKDLKVVKETIEKKTKKSDN
ncbi:MAG TPA: hypothetical protein ENJ89_01695 [Caldithrix abyssi]|uniref:Uncharacterized protein n=1 Tax=Caldithrix abyssi TaxID=187145 RepID=A0A7V5UDY7_CALAY|nr:hypothetical protein [Caldithrix abyssi]